MKHKTNLYSDAITALCKHNWPGNVRELKAVIERACIIFPGKISPALIFMKIYLDSKFHLLLKNEALWDMTSDLSGITNLEGNDQTITLKIIYHIKEYKNCFLFTMRLT